MVFSRSVYLSICMGHPRALLFSLRPRAWSACLAVALVELLEIGIDDVGSGIAAIAIAARTGSRLARNVAQARCGLRHALQCLANALCVLAFHCLPQSR